MSDLVTIDFDAGVADVRLNRPDKYNALSTDMFKAIADAGEALMSDPSVRAVVLSGNGRGFCAGLDMESFSAMADSSAPRKSGGGISIEPRADRPANFAQQTAYVWKQLPVPVIAAVHGVAYGAGIQIALAADMRIARPDARFSVMEIKWGLIPDVAISQTLRPLVPIDVAKDLVFTGRIVDATEAKALGLVTELADDPLEAAIAKARVIAGKSPSAIRAGKKLLEETWYEPDPAKGLQLEAQLQKTLIGRPNQVEAIRANFEKREPVFQDGE